MNALLQDPELMKAAMEQASKMSPESLAQMTKQMQSMPPGFLQEQMARMGQMGPAEMRRAREAMRNTNPAAAQQAFEQVAAQAEPAEIRQARSLKDAGNKHHAQGNFEQAAESYLLSKHALKSQTGAEAGTLRKACSLNLASCHLRTGDWQSCVVECGEVLASFPTDRKALYRRGQAFVHLGQGREAVSDLQEALKHSPEDEKAPIRAKLEEAKAVVLANGGPLVEEVDEVEEVRAEPQSTATPLPSASDPMAGFAQAAAAMQSNPDMMKAAMSMMQSMPPEQLESMMKSMGGGVPGGMPGGMGMGAGLATPAGLGGVGLPAVSEAGPSQPAASLPMQPDPAAMAGLLQNPAMMKGMQDMMKSLAPEDLKNMAKMAGHDLTTEQAQQMSEKFGNLSDAQMRRLLTVSSWLQSALATALRLWQVVLANKLLVLSVLVLVLAALLRLFGW